MASPEITQVERLQALEEEMAQANAEYIQAVNRASESLRFSCTRDSKRTGRKPARANMRGVEEHAG